MNWTPDKKIVQNLAPNRHRQIIEQCNWLDAYQFFCWASESEVVVTDTVAVWMPKGLKNRQ